MEHNSQLYEETKITAFPLKKTNNTWCTPNIEKIKLCRAQLLKVFKFYCDINTPLFSKQN